jgi:hypothetical protein
MRLKTLRKRRSKVEYIQLFFVFLVIITFRRVKWIYLIDWIDSGNFAAFAVIGVGVNVAVQFQRNAVNGRPALVLVQNVIFLHHLVGDILIQSSRIIIRLLKSFYSEFSNLWESGFVLKRHRKQLVVNFRSVDGLFDGLAEPQILDDGLKTFETIKEYR